MGVPPQTHTVYDVLPDCGLDEICGVCNCCRPRGLVVRWELPEKSATHADAASHEVEACAESGHSSRQVASGKAQECTFGNLHAGTPYQASLHLSSVQVRMEAVCRAVAIIEPLNCVHGCIYMFLSQRLVFLRHYGIQAYILGKKQVKTSAL